MAMKPVPKMILIVVTVAAIGFGLSKIDMTGLIKREAPQAVAPQVAPAPVVVEVQPTQPKVQLPEVKEAAEAAQPSNVTSGSAGMSAVLNAGKK